jgi:hypothetical protein
VTRLISPVPHILSTALRVTSRLVGRLASVSRHSAGRVALSLMLVAGVACHGKRQMRMAHDAPDALVAQLRARPLPYALQARFHVRVAGPGLSGTTSAALILSRPDRINVNVQTPLSTPLLYLATDGKVLNAYTQQDSTFYRGDDALSVLHELTGGAVSVGDLLLVLTGSLPLPDAKVLDVKVDGEAIAMTFEGPGGANIRAWIDPRTELVRRLEVARVAADSNDLETVVSVAITDAMHFQGGWLPEEMVLDLPTLGWRIELLFHTWDELGVIPDVFVLQPPAGSVEKDLVTTLKELAAEKIGRPAP